MPWGLAGGDVLILLGEIPVAPPPKRIRWFPTWSQEHSPTLMPIRHNTHHLRRMLPTSPNAYYRPKAASHRPETVLLEWVSAYSWAVNHLSERSSQGV